MIHRWIKTATYIDVRHDFFRICVFIAGCALACNFLPCEDRLDNYPRTKRLYVLFVDIIAGFGLNWRHCLPTLELELMGFKIKRNRS
jgi:hypothetical protein